MKQEMKQEMKREILFRGKRTFCNEWVYGDLGHFPDRTKIDTHENGQPWRGYDVFPETVGQFTGMIDKNGKKIFEGDIVRSYDPDYPESQMDCGVGQVEFYAGLWYVSGEVHNSLYDLSTISCKELEVIGNIHDNPELLEGGVEECG